MEIIRTENPRAVAGAIVSDWLKRYQERPVLLMLSGGSALTFLDSVTLDSVGPHVTITVVDERYSTDSQVSNFAQLEETIFFKNCVARGVSVIATTVQVNESKVALRERFCAALHAWRDTHPEGAILVTLGVGVDGHTAGLFPGIYDADKVDESWVREYVLPISVHEHTERVTVTPVFLKQEVTAALAFIVGDEKKSIVASLAGGTFRRGVDPYSLLTEMSSVTVVTDNV